MAYLSNSNSYLLSPGGGYYLRTYDEDELYSKFFISGYYGVWYPTTERQQYYSPSDIRTWTNTYSSLTSTFTSVLYPTYLSGVTAESIGTIVNTQYFQPVSLSTVKQNVGSFSSISAIPVYNHASAFYKMPHLSAKDINLALHTDHYIPDELYLININPILSLTATKTGTESKNTFPATSGNIAAEKYRYDVYDVNAQFAEGFPSAESGYYGRRMGVFDVNSEGSYLPSAFNVEIKSRWWHRAWTPTAIGDVPFSGLEKFTMSGKIPR
jgi:hypothetical protein